jgi:O-antigen ligase
MRVVRAGICVLVAFAVLCFGAVQSWSQAILEIGAALLLVLWAAVEVHEQRIVIRWNWIMVPIAGIPLIGALQWVSGTTIYGYATKVELLKWMAYVVLCFLAVQAIQTIEQLNAFAWFLIVLSFTVSLFAIAQHFAFNGKLYWFVELRQGLEPFGPYVNRDHFAGFVELTAPIGVAMLLFRGAAREKLPLLAVFTLVPVGALVLSTSRGGIIGFVFECLLLVILWPEREPARRRWLGTAVLAVLAAGFAAWLGITPAMQRFAQLSPGNLTRDRRLVMYWGTLRIIHLHHDRWIGTGLGTLQEAYPRYETVYDPLIVDHSHNDYLELLADTGLAGGLCGAAFLGLLAWKGFASLQAARSYTGRAIYAGMLAACAGLLLHSLIDFNLHIPANALLFLLLATIATSGVDAARGQAARAAT